MYADKRRFSSYHRAGILLLAMLRYEVSRGKSQVEWSVGYGFVLCDVSKGIPAETLLNQARGAVGAVATAQALELLLDAGVDGDL